MSMRIQLSRATSKTSIAVFSMPIGVMMWRLVRRITVLIDLLVHQVPVAVLCERWHLSPSCLYELAEGLSAARHGEFSSTAMVASPTEVDPKQKETLGRTHRCRSASRGFETACWNAVLIRVLIWHELVCCTTATMSVHYCITWAFRFKKARFVSDHSTRPSAWPGFRTSGRRLYGRPRVETA